MPDKQCNACMIGMHNKCSGNKLTCWCSEENHFKDDEEEEEDFEEDD